MCIRDRGYVKLHAASTEFNLYRSEARTAVFSNGADAQARNMRDRVSRFTQDLDPSRMDEARASVASALKYIAMAHDEESNPVERKNLDAQAERLKQSLSLIDQIQKTLLESNKIPVSYTHLEGYRYRLMILGQAILIFRTWPTCL